MEWSPVLVTRLDTRERTTVSSCRTLNLQVRVHNKLAVRSRHLRELAVDGRHLLLHHSLQDLKKNVRVEAWKARVGVSGCWYVLIPGILSPSTNPPTPIHYLARITRSRETLTGGRMHIFVIRRQN
jgi:hypothetical protein